MSSAATAASRCAGRRGPMTAASMHGCASTHASASELTSTPRLSASIERAVQPAVDFFTLEMPIRLRPKGHPRSFRIRDARAVFARQPSARQRTERREPHARVRAERKHLPLLRAVEEAVGVLHPFETRKSACVAGADRPGQTPGFDVAGADVEHLAGTHQVVKRGESLLHRRFRIRFVNEVHVQPVGLEPAKAGVYLS